MNIDFSVGSGLLSPKVGPAATGKSPGDVWNLYSRDDGLGGFRDFGQLSNMVWSDGSPSGIHLTVANAPGAWPNGSADAMYGTYLYPLGSEGPIELTVTNLPPGDYELYLYGHGGPGVDSMNTRFHVEAGGVSHGSKATTVGPEWAWPNWQEGAQYVRFSGVRIAGTADRLQVSAMRDAFAHPSLNGLQLLRVQGAPLWVEPNGGPFTNHVTVSLFRLAGGGEVRYSLDESEPTMASLLYQSPFVLTNSTTVRARLFINRFPASDPVRATFQRVVVPDVLFTPLGGWFTNSIEVTLVNRLSLGTVHYTTDGSLPTNTSPAYVAPVRLTEATRLQARVFFNGFPISETVAETYTRIYAFADDGVAFGWREQHFGPGFLTDPRAAADADPDGDGYTNREEFERGTIPTDRASAPAITIEVRAVPRLAFTTVPGKTYQVQRQSVLGDPVWQVLVPAFTATSTNSTFVDEEPPTPAYYRIQLVP